MNATHRRVTGRGGPGDPTAVLTEAWFGELAPFVLADERLRAIFDVDAIGGSGLVGVNQIAGIGCPPDRILEGSEIVRETTRFTLAIAATDEEFVLTGLVTEVGDPLAIGAPTGGSLGEPGGP